METADALDTTNGPKRGRRPAARRRAGVDGNTRSEGGMAQCASVAEGSPVHVDLAEVLTFAVELNRSRAARLGVRLHFYVLDHVIPSDRQLVLLQRLDMLVQQAVSRARRGTTLIGLAGMRDGSARISMRVVSSDGAQDRAIGREGASRQWDWLCQEACAGGEHLRAA